MANNPLTSPNSRAFYAWLDEQIQLGESITELANRSPETVPATRVLCKLAEWHNRLVGSRERGEWLSDHADEDGKDTGWEQHEYGNWLETLDPIRSVWLVCPSRMLVDPDLPHAHDDPRWRELHRDWREYSDWVGRNDQRRARLIQLNRRFGSKLDVCPWLVQWNVRKLRGVAFLTGRARENSPN